jgi:hypothetical protein
MSAVPPTDETLRRLRNASPEAFERFVNEVEAYTNALTVAVTEASPDTILVAQGRAQAMRKLLQIMRASLQR